MVRRQGGAPEPYPQGFGLGGTTLISGGLASPDPELFAVSHLLPIEKAERLGMLGAAVLDADARARPATLVRHNGERVTVADIYLRPALLAHQPDGGDRVASRVAGARRLAVARAVTADGIEYEADRFVVCAGAIETPALLLRSGLDTPGIGEGLQDHPACAITVELGAGSDVEAPAISVVRRPRQPAARAAQQPAHAPGYGALLAGVMAVTSAGRVSLPDPDGVPHVELRQLSTSADVTALTDALSDMLELLETESLKAVVRRAYIDDHGTPAASIAGDRDRVRDWAIANVVRVPSPVLDLPRGCR